MRRSIFTAFLVAGLLLQGAIAAAVEVLPDDAASSHCVGSEPAPADGDCCDDAMSAACAAQCQVGEAPVALVLPVRDEVFGGRVAAADLSIPNPSYIPDLRPPIA